jgi:hypothetical protein
LGVSRQGDFENTGGKNQYVSKTITGEMFFRGAIFFLDGFFYTFSFDLFVVALVKRLLITNVLRGRASNLFPLFDFFIAFFGRFSIRGTQKRDKKSLDRTYV